MNREDVEKIYRDTQLLQSGSANSINIGLEGDSVIAGEDDRKDIYMLSSNDTDDLRKRLAASTVLLTNKSRLTERADGSYDLEVQSFQNGGMEPCVNEPFRDQHIGGWCSGFLVGPDLIATAGHCGESLNDIQDTAYVFGFDVSEEGNPGATVFPKEQVYFGTELVAHELSDIGDYAVIKVDRTVTASDSTPLPVRNQGVASIGSAVGVIGHPSGLPCKISFGDSTVIMDDEGPWLFANLDTYGGNSGSPVFNTNGQVEGILVRGATDYVFENNCFRSNRILNANGSEAITKASIFASLIDS